MLCKVLKGMKDVLPSESARWRALEREMRRALINVPVEKWDEFMAEIARRQRLNSAEELYAAIGYGGLQISRLMGKLKDEYSRLREAEAAKAFTMEDVPIHRTHTKDGVVVEGIDNSVEAFLDLMKGANTGKMLVRI